MIDVSDIIPEPKIIEPQFAEDENVIFIDLPPTLGISDSTWTARAPTEIISGARRVKLPCFESTIGVRRKVGILNAHAIFEKTKVTGKDIIEQGTLRGWMHGDKVNPEVAYYLRLAISDNLFADYSEKWRNTLFITVMHKPITCKHSNGRARTSWEEQNLFAYCRHGWGYDFVATDVIHSDKTYHTFNNAFAFLVSEHHIQS